MEFWYQGFLQMEREPWILKLLKCSEAQISTTVPDSLWNTKASFITEINLCYTHLLKPKDIFIKTTVYKDESSAIAV